MVLSLLPPRSADVRLTCVLRCSALWISAAVVAPYPEISLHLLAASPTAAWMKHVDRADAFLTEPLSVTDGRSGLPDRPGLGIRRDESRIAALSAG